MEGRDVVSSDDHKIGTVVAERGDCVIVERGHVFKSRHAIPRTFLHDLDGELRATVAKELIADSPHVDLEHWDGEEVNRHYGLVDDTVVDPDPDGVVNAETVGLHHGIEPAPAERLGTLGGEGDPSIEEPAAFDDNDARRVDEQPPRRQFS